MTVEKGLEIGMLSCRQLSAGYQKEKVISGVNLELAPGELVAIIGPNGSGKSTLLRALLGILRPMEGQVLYGDTPVTELPPREIARKVSFLSQSRDTPDILAGRLVMHGRFPWMGVPRRYTKQDEIIAAEAMKRTGCLQFADRRLSSLSGGQRQAVYLAMILAQDTQTVLLDEPTTYLDIQNQFQLLETARELTGQGRAVVIVLHDLPMALNYANKLVVMQQGRLQFCGKPREALDSGCIEEVFRVRVLRHEYEGKCGFHCEPL